MPAMTWSTLLNSPQVGAAGTTLSASTSLTDVSPAPQFTLPANFLQVGSALRLTASGVFTSAASTPGTILIGFYYGGVAGTSLVGYPATTLPTSASNWTWRLEATCTVRTNGTAGTIWSSGVSWIATSATAFTTQLMPQSAPAVVSSLDTTTAKVLSVGAQFSSATTNTLTCHQFMIESLGM